MAHMAHAKAVMETEKRNLYMKMPLDRVRHDALEGVSLARIAWRIRQPVEAGRVLGFVVEPSEQAAALGLGPVIDAGKVVLPRSNPQVEPVSKENQVSR